MNPVIEAVLHFVKKGKRKLIGYRRDFHKYPESGWCEFRTASKIADVLHGLGYNVMVGEEVIETSTMMGVPAAQELELEQQRAVRQGANFEWVKKMSGGKTGVMGTMKFHQPGPTIAFRFDIDANDVAEAESEDHLPWREGFASVNKGIMHACGHDGHAAIGLMLAEVIAQFKDQLTGCIKIIFQPAEEGVRGAKAMAAAGVVNDVDYFFGMHLGLGLKQTGMITCKTEGFLATTKLDAIFKGTPAHAGAAPEAGRNALLAAATAALNIHAIARHSEGASRVNVGVLHAGSGRNVVPANAILKLETRGETAEINGYIYHEVIRILYSAAQMHQVTVELTEVGSAIGCNNDPELAARLNQLARKSNLFGTVLSSANLGGSEDCAYFMERVQQCGGKAAYLMIGSDLAAGHHDSYFDFDESILATATAFLSTIAIDFLMKH